MKTKFYNLPQSEFTNVLQEMRGRGTPETPFMDKLGLLYLVKNEDRTVFQMFYMTHDETAFVAEYIQDLESLAFISGDVAGFKSVFPNVNLTDAGEQK